jgi:hypothetical protein
MGEGAGTRGWLADGVSDSGRILADVHGAAEGARGGWATGKGRGSVGRHAG